MHYQPSQHIIGRHFHHFLLVWMHCWYTGKFLGMTCRESFLLFQRFRTSDSLHDGHRSLS